MNDDLDDIRAHFKRIYPDEVSAEQLKRLGHVVANTYLGESTISGHLYIILSKTTGRQGLEG